MAHWTTRDIPSQQGKIAVVTGGTGGLGYQIALALARAGAETIVAGRNPAKGAAALAAIRKRAPGAAVAFELLDLASLASVAAFAARIERPLDLLVNNAGIMAVPERRVTQDGFELQLGTNYLGHFALTGRLLPRLRAAAQARVVSLSSLAHMRGRIDFADLQGARRYRPWPAYSQSKLAMLLFAGELQRRSDGAGWDVTSLAAHPGWARTDIFTNGPAPHGLSAVPWRAMRLAAPFFAQSAAMGALPVLYAATAPAAKPGAYYGPDGPGEVRGWPKSSKLSPAAQDAATGAKLWASSSELTHVSFA